MTDQEAVEQVKAKVRLVAASEHEDCPELVEAMVRYVDAIIEAFNHYKHEPSAVPEKPARRFVVVPKGEAS